MKRIALATVALAVGVGTVAQLRPEQFKQYSNEFVAAAPRLWDRLEANPTPVLIALGTFLATVVYHKARGKSLRESVEVAATRVTVVSVPTPPAAEPETPVVRRAKARATRAQLIADQILLQNRYRRLPEAVTKAEKEACYTEQAVTECEQALAGKRATHNEAAAKLEALRKEWAEGEAELAEIDAELKRLAELV